MMLLSILLIMVDNFSFQDVREHINDVIVNIIDYG